MRQRITDLQNMMRRDGFAAAIFMHPRDVFYYAGTGQPGNLIIPASGEPLLLVRRAFEWAKEDAAVRQIIRGKGLSEVRESLNRLGLLTAGEAIGISLDLLPATLYRKFQEVFPECIFRNISPLVLEQRMIKDTGEIKAIGNAAALYSKAHEVILSCLRPGITELELAARVSAALRQGEHEGIVRFRRWDASLNPDGIICAGDNTWRISGHAMTVTGKGLSAAFPWGASRTTIQSGDLVVADLGLNFHGYHADVARTYVVGKADAKQKHIFKVVREIQDNVLKVLRPGVTGQELYRAAQTTALLAGVQEYFQGYGDMQGDYVGHGVGLEIDEPPTLDSKSRITVRQDMTLALEPKVIIPGWGAIDLEDTVHVTETGHEIMCPVPRELFEVT